ncbi:MAG: UDP-N-acetylglucosamine--N-acetylmuramyl-(pentapeptide) pyrophosphoryl-undecaprenol N-acetylglucosamine transferase [Candidatus Cloacimonetes bacterium]|nr:UDP-N-acetylglucosamine--N-acetylmuramyl-(pentapeptide) pyrophosphoryl-undecaprenol N-acetylglucosamine transferase [Candidatus Cloacimonadota bacterium]
MKCHKIIVSAGGTGGHIIPALNISKSLLKRGISVCYIGNKDSMEQTIIEKNGISFFAIDVQKLYRAWTMKHFLFPYKLLKAINQCTAYIYEQKPDAFIGFGGFVSGAPALAAKKLKIPVYLQEQNAKPGITNYFTGKFADTAFLAYPESVRYFKKCTSIITGNPINIDMANNLRDGNVRMPDRASVHSQGNKRVLILGGSQGSMFINKLILKNIELFESEKIDIVWQTGRSHLQNIDSELKKMEVKPQISITTFDFTDKIEDMYTTVDYVIARSGAMSLAEIESYRLPVFMIPLVTAAVNEQYHNAIWMQNKEFGMMFEQKDQELFPTRFKDFMAKASQMHQSKEPSRHLSATETIVDTLIQNIERKKG